MDCQDCKYCGVDNDLHQSYLICNCRTKKSTTSEPFTSVDKDIYQCSHCDSFTNK